MPLATSTPNMADDYLPRIWRSVTFLLTNWKLIGLGLIVLAVGGYIGVLKLELRHCSSERSEERRVGKECRL